MKGNGAAGPANIRSQPAVSRTDPSAEQIQERWQKIIGAHVMQGAAQQVHIEQLQNQLWKAKEEIESLRGKVAKLERKERLSSLAPNASPSATIGQS